MSMQDAVPPGSSKGLTPCPSCGGSATVASVPAVFHTAGATETVIAHAERVIRDDDSTRAEVRAARTAIASTGKPVVPSRLLAPAPSSTMFPLGAGAAFSAFMAFATGQFSDTVSSTVSVLAGTGTVGFCVALGRSFRRNARVRAGRPAAEAVWHRGWYCERCGVVYFQPGEQPSGTAEGQTLSPEQFRRLVWSAGGYGQNSPDPKRLVP